MFGISKNTQENTVDNVRTKRYNHKACKQQQHNQSAASNSADDIGNKSFTASQPSPHKTKDERSAVGNPPFPFRVAKSLDPEFYRNAQYDHWLDLKKGQLV